MESIKNIPYVAFNGTTPLLTTKNQCATIIASLVSGAISGFEVANFFQNTSDYFMSIIYYPIKIESFIPAGSATANTSFYIGNSQTAYNYDNTTTSEFIESLKVFEYEATRTHNNFLDFEPYTSFKIYYPFFDAIDISPKYMYNKIYGYISIDFTNGNATLYITDTNGIIIAQKTAIIGIQFPLGHGNQEEQNRNNVLQAISLAGSVAGVVAGVASGNPLITAGSIGIGTKAITQFLQNNVDTYTGNSGGGNRSSLACDKQIVVFKETPKNEKLPNASLVGRPCHSNKTLSTLTGFTKVGEIHFNPNGEDIFDDEIEEIVSLLHGGVIL